MSKVKTITSAFNAGELSPKVYGRVDLQQYYNGCKSLLNTIVYPQGGCSKRFGFEMIGTLGVDPAIDPRHVRIEEFIFNTDETFVVILSGDGGLRVYDCSNGQLTYNVATSYTNDMVNELSVHQSQDTMIITHPSVKPMSLVRDRTGSITNWTFTELAMTNVPVYSFTPPAVTTWTTATMRYDQFVSGDIYTLKFKGNNVQAQYTITKEYIDDYTPNVWHENASTAVESLSAVIGDDYTIEATYRTISISDQGITYHNMRRFAGMKLTAKDQTSGGAPVERFSIPAGRSLIIEATGTTTGGVQVDEPVWSDTRGWPATVTIHQGRLWFGGSKSRPQTLWSSRSGNYFDFGVTDPDELLANDALDITLSDTKSNLITSMVSQKTLMVFTNGGVFTIDGEGGLVTPTTVFALKQSEFGSKRTPPVQLDNAVMYLQSQGAQLNSIVYSYASDSYVSDPQALLSDHLLKGPRSMSVIGAADDYNSNFMFVCNNDGTLAMFNRLASQETSTWTPVKTDGFISSTCGVFSSMWCVVQRNNALGEKLFVLERYAEGAAYMDSYITVSLEGEVTTNHISPENRGLFKGRDLVAVADGYPIKVKCSEAGFVDLPFRAKKIQLGLPFEMEIETMPYAVDLQSGSTRFSRKRVMSATFDMINSLGFDVIYAGRKYQVADRKMGFRLKEPPKPISDVKEMKLLGYNQDGNIKISSTEPVAVNLRSLQIEVSVTG